MFKKIILPVSLVLALTPFVLFPVCDSLKADGTHMACWYSGLLITAMGVLIFALSLLKGHTAVRTGASIVSALACWFIPNRIITLQPFGLCAASDHACRASTMPVVGIIVIVIIAVSVSGLIVSFVKGE